MQQVWAFDEGRFGLTVWFRRRWCPVGVRPPWVVEDAYAWRWLYAAAEPATGRSYFLLLPGVDTVCLQTFLDGFADVVGPGRVGMVLDGSGAHHAAGLRWPDNLVPLPLPPYAPELNPVELLFRQLRTALANRIFADVAALEEALMVELQRFWDDPAVLHQLTGFPWWLDALQAIPAPAA